MTERPRLAAIQAFADTVPITQIDPALVNSKALRLVDGTVASGGNRYESAQIGLWEFKTGSGTTAYDTSGVTPSLDLTLSGEYEWFGGWGVTINNGRAQGSTGDSRKLHDRIRLTGEYSIEAWVVPANVTQEMSRIVTYSAGDTARNFSLQQTLYNYDFLHRSTTTGGNGDNPQLSLGLLLLTRVLSDLAILWLTLLAVFSGPALYMRKKDKINDVLGRVRSYSIGRVRALSSRIPGLSRKKLD